MKQCKTKVVTVLLAAILGLSALLGFAGANRNTASAAVGEEEPFRVGLTVPQDEPVYIGMANSLAAKSNQTWDLTITYAPNAEYQHEQIMSFIAEEYKTIIVAPINANSIASALQEAHKAGIAIIVLGHPNINYPRGTLYVTQDYYMLGWQHVESIQNDRPLDEVANIYILYKIDNLYENNENEMDYVSGIHDALTYYNCPATVYDVAIETAAEAYDAATDWISQSPDYSLKNEVVSDYMAFAEEALSAYYTAGYHDCPTGIGTGIRVLRKKSGTQPMTLDNDGEGEDEEVDISEEFAKQIAEILDALFNGEDFPTPSTYFNGGPVYYIQFVPGRVQYVH